MEKIKTNSLWNNSSKLQKIGLLLLMIVNPRVVGAITGDRDQMALTKEKRELDKLNKARELVRNYKVEFRRQSSFLSSGTYRELTLRDKPLSDIEVDDIMKSINPVDVLKTEM